jgi:hypothetical protein
MDNSSSHIRSPSINAASGVLQFFVITIAIFGCVGEVICSLRPVGPSKGGTISYSTRLVSLAPKNEVEKWGNSIAFYSFAAGGVHPHKFG